MCPLPSCVEEKECLVTKNSENVAPKFLSIFHSVILFPLLPPFGNVYAIPGELLCPHGPNLILCQVLYMNCM